MSSSTEPSRGDFATASAPTTPAAPALFSTITGIPSRAESGVAIARATTSLLPPAENGTTILIVLGSGACAQAPEVPASAAANARPIPNPRVPIVVAPSVASVEARS